MTDDSIISKFLERITSMTDKEDVLESAIDVIKKYLCVDAVGIRIRENGDFPYYTTIGFSKEFISKENLLCTSASCKNPECLCGMVVDQKYPEDITPDKYGSIIIKYPANINCPQRKIRATCFMEGYQVVALVPIYYNEKSIGLIQINTMNKDTFNDEKIIDIEQLSAIIGKSLGGILENHEKHYNKKEKIVKNARSIANDIRQLIQDMRK